MQWVILNTKLHAGDVLFIKSIDRLGRNYAEIISVWGSLTKERGVKFGRPRVQTPRNFGWIAHDVLRGALTQSEGARLCNMKLSTFRLRVKDARKRILRSLK